MLNRILGVVLGVVLLVGQVLAAEPDDTIRSKIKAIIPSAVVTSIKLTPMPGFYQVQATGYETFYISADGHFILQGDLLEVRGNQMVDLTDEAEAQNRKAALAAVNRQDMIVFPAAGNKPKGAIYVFTDVECAYCRKLHTEVPTLNKMGIEVRYLAFPRSGPKSPVAAKMAKVWCAVDRNTALTEAKKDIPAGKQRPGCKAPVDEQFALGLSLGVTGTPAVYLEDGTQVGGYISAPDLAKEMHLK